MGISVLRSGITQLTAIEPRRAEIKAGIDPTFVKALDEYCGGLVNVEPSKIVTAQFCGVDVVENDLLPKNMAAIIQDGAVISLIRFADA